MITSEINASAGIPYRMSAFSLRYGKLSAIKNIGHFIDLRYTTGFTKNTNKRHYRYSVLAVAEIHYFRWWGKAS
jgi:hypothetical protein